MIKAPQMLSNKHWGSKTIISTCTELDWVSQSLRSEVDRWSLWLKRLLPKEFPCKTELIHDSNMYYTDGRIYLNLSKSIQSAAALNALKPGGSVLTWNRPDGRYWLISSVWEQLILWNSLAILPFSNTLVVTWLYWDSSQSPPPQWGTADWN